VVIVPIEYALSISLGSITQPVRDTFTDSLSVQDEECVIEAPLFAVVSMVTPVRLANVPLAPTLVPAMVYVNTSRSSPSLHLGVSTMMDLTAPLTNSRPTW